MKKLVLSLSTFALIAASIFVFSSCEKEEKQDETIHASFSSQIINNNPYYYIGELHNQGYLSSNNYNAVQNAANEFENFLAIQENEEQKTALYIASSVLLGSFSYWTQEFEKGANSEWFGILHNMTDSNAVYYNATLSQKQKEDILLADVEGAAIGAIGGAATGGTIGSFAPGPGTISGTIAGMLIGGLKGGIVSSSVRAAVATGGNIIHYVKHKK